MGSEVGGWNDQAKKTLDYIVHSSAASQSFSALPSRSYFLSSHLLYVALAALILTREVIRFSWHFGLSCCCCCLLLQLASISSDRSVSSRSSGSFQTTCVVFLACVQGRRRYVCVATTATLALQPDVGVFLARLGLVLGRPRRRRPRGSSCAHLADPPFTPRPTALRRHSRRATPPVSAIATSLALYATLQGQQAQRSAGAPSSSAAGCREKSRPQKTF